MLFYSYTFFNTIIKLAYPDPQRPTKWYFERIEHVISFSSPASSKWRLIERLKEIDRQLPEEEVRRTAPGSYASLRILCQRHGNPSKKAFIRIYQQVPWTKPAMHDAKTSDASYIYEGFHACRADSLSHSAGDGCAQYPEASRLEGKWPLKVNRDLCQAAS